MGKGFVGWHIDQIQIRVYVEAAGIR